MQNAAKRKSISPVSLAAVRVLLLLVVALCLGQTRVWGFGITSQPASGVFESVTPSSTGENTIGSGYDASDSPLDVRVTPDVSQYGRVTHRAGVREAVWERSKAPDGKVYDPSGVEIKPGEPFDLGHIPGHELSIRKPWAAEQGWTRKDWLDYQNDPDIYRPEIPRNNQSHINEDPWYDVR